MLAEISFPVVFVASFAIGSAIGWLMGCQHEKGDNAGNWAHARDIISGLERKVNEQKAMINSYERALDKARRRQDGD